MRTTPPTFPLVRIRESAKIMPMNISAESRDARNPPSPFLFEITNPEIAPETRSAASDTVFTLPTGFDVVTQEMQEIWVRFLGWEDPLEAGMEIHSSILAWRSPWTEEPGSPSGR